MKKGREEVLLYLDYDGVLHPESVWRSPKRGVYIHSPKGHALFENNVLLRDVLKSVPEVRVVLSTSWVRALGFTQAKKRLLPAVRERVIGATFHSQMAGDSFADAPRWQQILRDVQRRKPRGWVAVDDDDRGWPAEHAHHLVSSNPQLGIGDPRVLAELMGKLIGICGRTVRED